MKTADTVSAEKLRGGFYSPDDLVTVCLDRAQHLLAGRSNLTVLEPSAGDGAFIRGLGQHTLGESVREVTAVELLDEEASKADNARRAAAFGGRTINGSLLAPPQADIGAFDLAVGNPPFVRFQFVPEEDRRGVDRLATRLGVEFSGVGNLWIPVFLSALARLNDGGVFSFIIPAECFTGLSARVVRRWLGRHTSQLRIDLFPPKSFPGVLQEVVILSGRVTRQDSTGTKVLVHDHALNDSWRHVLDESEPTWTGLLLPPDHLDAVNEVIALDAVHRLGDVARLSVATVTGANDFFSLTDISRNEHGLSQWSRPMIARVRHARGLDYTSDEHQQNANDGHPSWLLDTSVGDTNINDVPDARAYIQSGEEAGLHERYKCRIRTPWHAVPVVAPGTLMLSKRSHRYPRLIRNSAGAVSTDTIYQGTPRPAFVGREADIVASFHNSLTLLSAELYGRSFGGGVLELVPSEVRALLIPVGAMGEAELERLDRLVRCEGTDSEALVAATDKALEKKVPSIDRDAWKLISKARRVLLDRRLART